MKLFQQKNTIKLCSGVPCTVKELVGKHQRLLTENKVQAHLRFNNLLVDVIEHVEGIDYETMNERQKLDFVTKMLSCDRNKILEEARQLANSHNAKYIHHFEYKTANGTKKTEKIDIHLIDEDNRKDHIDNILETFYKTEAERESKRELVEELNRIGCFPTRPTQKNYDNYNDVLENKEVITRIGDYEFLFAMLDGRLEENAAKVYKREDSMNSHAIILTRLPRYREIGAELWEKVTSEILDVMSVPAVEALRTAMLDAEGEVDTVEIIEHPETGKEIKINIISEVDFFFPSGRL
jgi:hypothetical protein